MPMATKLGMVAAYHKSLGTINVSIAVSIAEKIVREGGIHCQFPCEF